jgi:hypothetical protein
MLFRAVDNRCAVDVASFDLSITDEEAVAILERHGFRVLDVDMVALARSRVGVSRFVYGAKRMDAPETFDCSSFMRWLYGLRGVWIPRRAIQQKEFGVPVELRDLLAGDLVFTVGFRHRVRYTHQLEDGVGHVLMATGEGTLICATKSDLGEGIIELSVEEVLRQREYRGAVRVIPPDRRVSTVESSGMYTMETSDDLRWIILRCLARYGTQRV